MKKLYYFFSIMLMLALVSCSFSRDYAQPVYLDGHGGDYETGVTYQQFYDELSPYGNWISYPGYGYAWVPQVAGFRPYSTNGYWVYTTLGWTWMSNYRWGWAPFHYGRWMLDARFGWLWIPGYEWAPAWVAWRGGGGYYGWAPLGPGMGINISIGVIPNNYWSFVPNKYINSRSIGNYYVSNNTTIINNTTVINNNYYNNDRTVVYNTGPRISEVEKATSTKIAPIRVINSSAPGSTAVNNNELSIYRPQVRELSSSSSRPSRLVNESVNQAEVKAPVRSLNNMNSSSEINNVPVREIPSSNLSEKTTEDRRVPAAKVETEQQIGSSSIRNVRPSVPERPEEKQLAPSVINTPQSQSRSAQINTSTPSVRRTVEPRPVHIAPPKTESKSAENMLRNQAPAQMRTIAPENRTSGSTPSAGRSASGNSMPSVKR